MATLPLHHDFTGKVVVILANTWFLNCVTSKIAFCWYSSRRQIASEGVSSHPELPPLTWRSGFRINFS